MIPQKINNYFFLSLLLLISFFIFVKSTQNQKQQSVSNINHNHNQPNNKQQFIFLFFTKQCYHKYFTQYDFLSSHCLQKTAIKVLSYGLIFGGMIIKLPQIVRIIIDKSVFGISIWSITLQSIGQLSITVYNFDRQNPFSVYGQSIFMVIGNFLITLLFFIYKPKGGKWLQILNIILISATPLIMLNSQILPHVFYQNCIFVQLALLSIARLNQIIHIFKHGSTGSLSFIMIFCQVIGNIGRFVTICFDAANDWKFKLFVFSAFCFNLFLLIQFFIYWGKKGDKDKYQKLDNTQIKKDKPN